MFRSGRLSVDVEDDGGARYLFWVEMFRDLVNFKEGHFIRLPFPGSYMDQPYITVLILKIIQSEYISFLVEKRGVKNPI